MKITKKLVKEIYEKMQSVEVKTFRSSPYSSVQQYRELTVDGVKFQMFNDRLYPHCNNAPLLAKMNDGEIFYTFNEDFNI